MGAHQKLDRLARARLSRLLLEDDAVFPGIRPILHFEGANGPDAIKRKSPARDEPWHYYAPLDSADTRLPESIGRHYARLVCSLETGDSVRAAFEAAWLAHAVIDGLTPAHHFPYEAALTELRGGEGILTRTSVRTKLVLPGETRREQLINNWKMWGPHGLMATHGFFEIGIATLITPLTVRSIPLTVRDLGELCEYGAVGLFVRTAKEIDGLGMYDRYYAQGWTPRLARQVRTHLVPAMVKTVVLSWYGAAVEAGVVLNKREVHA